MKITSVNAPIIIFRQVIALFIRRIISTNFGEIGIDVIGQVRSVIQIITSISTFGFFNGIVKYVSEYKEDSTKLTALFSTSIVYWSITSLLIAIVMGVFSEDLSVYFFETPKYATIVIILGLAAPFIGLQRLYNGVINGLTQYKKYAKVDILSYLIATSMMFYFIWNNMFIPALIVISVTPVIQLIVILFVFTKVFKEYIVYKKIEFKAPFSKKLLAFTIISFSSTVILNVVEILLRNIVRVNISQVESGIWSGMLDLSKNYMAFSSLLLTMYVIPKFATITTGKLFFSELKNIYKTLLPIFGVGMIVVYFCRSFIIDLIFPGFDSMEALFKWQLIGDFIRLGSIILATQFLAKRMVKSFIFSELLSHFFFFSIAYFLIPSKGVEGIVIAHFIRYILYFIVVLLLIIRYFKKKDKELVTVNNE